MISSLVKKQNKDKKFVYDYDPKKINAYFPKPKGPKTYKQKINLKILKPKKLKEEIIKKLTSSNFRITKSLPRPELKQLKKIE